MIVITRKILFILFLVGMISIAIDFFALLAIVFYVGNSTNDPGSIFDFPRWVYFLFPLAGLYAFPAIQGETKAFFQIK